MTIFKDSFDCIKIDDIELVMAQSGIAVYYYSGSLGSGKLIQSDVMPGNLSWDLIVSETVSAKNWALACGKH